MKTLLIGINAKYTHSNLAIRYIKKYACKSGLDVHISEYTINQQMEQIIADIYKRSPDVLGLSCYIWNIEYISKIIKELKIILPDLIVILGGPEVSFNPKERMSENSDIDYIISGDGEEDFTGLIHAIQAGRKADNICGVTYRSNDAVQSTAERFFNFEETIFPYDDVDFGELKNRKIYYETQRGCPFKCSYCLSSAGEKVLFLPALRVYDELKFFIDRKVRQVKFVDRTFNCNKTHSRDIWRFLIRNDNGITNFHFEISANLLENEDFEILRTARAALFQFEIGVQSTSVKTLAEIERHACFPDIAKNVLRLQEAKNIHLHLDLIAGLPYEDYKSFKKSLNDILSLKPDMLQLGFLKVLKGSKMSENAKKYELKHSSYAPYIVYSTKWMTYEQLLKLKSIETVIEIFYNSGIARNSIEYQSSFFKSKFDYFYELGQFWEKNNYSSIKHNKMKVYERLFEFFVKNIEDSDEISTIAKELIRFDFLLNDNISLSSTIFEMHLTESQLQRIEHFYNDRERIESIEKELLKYDKKLLKRQSKVEIFTYDVTASLEKRETAVFFHYLSSKAKGKPIKIEI